MTFLRLLLRSLWHHRWANLGVLLGAAVCSGVLLGALAVGDSVRGTLAEQARLRIGRVEWAAASDRYFRAELADELRRELGGPFAPLIVLPASAGLPDESRRAIDVQLLGVDKTFFSLSPGGSAAAPGGDEVWLNEPLARQLGVRAGEEILLIVPKPSLLPRDAPLIRERKDTMILRRRVARIITPAEFSRFSLRSEQVRPHLAIVDRSAAAEELARPGRANVMLAGGADYNETSLRDALGRVWTLADAGAELRGVPDKSMRELRSDRIFLDEPLVDAARAAAPEHSARVLTYLVNEIRLGDRATPYSMLTGIEPVGPYREFLGELQTGEIILNTWLAEDLRAEVGDKVALKFFVLAEGNELREETVTFRVTRIADMEGPAADPSLMPELPGIAGADDCDDWKPGIPIVLDRIRPKDEEYWDEHRGTPKAFIRYDDAGRLWANRFGSATAVRFSPQAPPEAELREAIRNDVSPHSLGLSFRDVARAARRGVEQSLDFGLLFLGLSFFLIASALGLTGLVGYFSVMQRGRQIGMLRALGFSPGGVRRLLLTEGAVASVVGCGLGAVGGWAYAAGLLKALGGAWAGAVAGWPIRLHIAGASVAIALGGTFLATLVVMFLAARQAGKMRIARLLGGDAPEGSSRSGRPLWPIVIALMVLGVAAFGGLRLSSLPAELAWFALATFALLALLGMVSILFRPGARGDGMSVVRLVRSGLGRRRGRNIAAVGTLAAGVFITLSVLAFYQQPLASRGEVPGTGGFDFYAQSSLPIHANLATAKGREAFGLDKETFRGVRIVPLRLREGDDASCLNLNRPQNPRLLGAQVRQMKGTFRVVTPEGGWEALSEPGTAMADKPTLDWALYKQVGDAISVRDAEGQTHDLKIVGAIESSMLQGSVLVSEETFLELFPDSSGYRALLIDAPPGRSEAIVEALSKAGSDYGLAVEPAPRRLARFAQVQNTYLRIFLVLGGLGILLGSGGFGVVVARNVFQRRGELAMLRSLGWPRRNVVTTVIAEHLLLLAAGLGCGIGAAGIMLLRAGWVKAAALPWSTMAVVVGVIAAGGAMFVLTAAKLAVRGGELEALRKE